MVRDAGDALAKFPRDAARIVNRERDQCMLGHETTREFVITVAPPIRLPLKETRGQSSPMAALRLRQSDGCILQFLRMFDLLAGRQR